MKLSTRTQFALLAIVVVACAAALGPATMPVWRNPWSTNQPPRSVEGNNDLEVTNIPGKLAWRFYAGSTNTVARKADTSNDVAVTAGANVTVTPSGAGGRMSYAVASTASSGATTNPNQFGVSSQLTLKKGAFQTNANFWESGTNHGKLYLNDGADLLLNSQTTLHDVGAGELALGSGFSLLDAPNIKVNFQDALVDQGGGMLGVGLGLGAAYLSINIPALVLNNQAAMSDAGGSVMTLGNGFSVVDVHGYLQMDGMVALHNDGAGTLEVGLGASQVLTPSSVGVGTITPALFDNAGNLEIGAGAFLNYLIPETLVVTALRPSTDLAVQLGAPTFRWLSFDTFGITVYSPNASIPTNTAAIKTVAPANLHNIAIGKGWTNDLGARADMVISFSRTDAVGGNPALAFTNSITGEAWTNTITGGVVVTIQDTIVIPDISPNDRGSFTDVSTGAGSAMAIKTAWWKLK